MNNEPEYLTETHCSNEKIIYLAQMTLCFFIIPTVVCTVVLWVASN